MTSEYIYIYYLKDPRTRDIRYVGRSNNPRKRLQSQLSMARTGRRKNHLHSWLINLERDGLMPEQFIIEKCQQWKWRNTERYWIQYFVDCGEDLVNLAKGGYGCDGRVMPMEERERRSEVQLRRWANASEEDKRRHSDSLSKYWNSEEGKAKARRLTNKRYEDPRERELQSIRMKQVLSNPELRQKLSDIQVERYKDPREREKMSIAGKKHYSNPNNKVIHSEETKRKMSISAQNRPSISNETRNKMSQSSKRRYSDPQARHEQSERMKQWWADRKVNNI